MQSYFSQAKWIGAPGCPAHTAPVFRRAFTWAGGASARLYITGVGFYSLRVNGKTVSDELLNPAFSRYDKTVYYQMIPLSEELNPGENVIEVTLGNGWYNQQQPDAWQFEQAVWKQSPRMICALYANEELLLASDSRWQWAESATVFNSLRCGETCDARVTPDFCHQAAVFSAPGGELKLQSLDPIRLRRTLEPVSVTALGEDTLYDFGVSIAGNAQITVSGLRGARVTLRYAELTSPDEGINTRNIRELVYDPRFQQDEYILSGTGEETWHSRFGYNGFRYMQVSCEGCRILRITARQFHTDLQLMGGFTAEDASLNRIQSAILQSTLTNFHHIPTDCPHREKNGWTGDAYLSCRQAMYNFDMRRAYIKWLDDIVDCQRPSGQIPCIAPTSAWGYAWGSGVTWDAVLAVIPWEMYRAYGDESVLRRYAEPLRRYLAFLESMLENGIPAVGLGDWCPPREAEIMPEEALRACMAIHMGQLCEQMGRIIGDGGLEAQGRTLAETCAAAFHRDYDILAGQTHAQLYYALRLYLHLTDDPQQELQWLADSIEYAGGHVMGGIFTARFLPEALTDNGRFDLAWKIASAPGYPGWDDLARRCSGTLGECWNGDASQNHHMFSAIGAWYYEAIAGIRPAAPGYARILIAPHIPEGIPGFHAWHETPHGRVSVDFSSDVLTVSVPEGIPASLAWNGEVHSLSGGVHRFPAMK